MEPPPPSFEELCAELKSLKKRLYTFKLKGMELHQKAKNHWDSHSMAEQSGHSTVENFEKETDMKVSAFGLNRGTNPLSNEYILEMVAYYLPWKDLQTCKKVCRLWSKEFGRCELKRKSIVLSSDNPTDGDAEMVKKLVDDKTSGVMVNVGTLVVLSLNLESLSVQSVVRNFGCTLSSLRLDECDITAQELYSVLRHLPYLDHLSVKSHDLSIPGGPPVPLAVPRGGPSGPSPLDQITSDSFSPLEMKYLRELSWEDIRPICSLDRLPKMFPNLVALQISNLGNCNPSLFNDSVWRDLRNLDLKLCDAVKLQYPQLLAVTKMNLKLKILVLKNVIPGRMTKSRMRQLHSLLLGTKTSLQELKILRQEVPPHEETSEILCSNLLPDDMPSLTSLLTNLDFSGIFEFARRSPKLNKLRCKSHSWMLWWKVMQNKSINQHPTVRVLNLGVIDSGCMRKMADGFPFVTVLEVFNERVDDVFFRTVCGNLTKLRTLRISENIRTGGSRNGGPWVERLHITDAGITGIPSITCESILANDGTVCRDIDFLRAFPNIKSLKDLQVLELSNVPSLTDVSLFHGFASSSSLMVLILPVCKITDTSILSLPNFTCSKDPDGTRRIRVKSSQGAGGGVALLLDIVTDHSQTVTNPFTLFGEIVAELNQDDD